MNEYFRFSNFTEHPIWIILKLVDSLGQMLISVETVLSTQREREKKMKRFYQKRGKMFWEFPILYICSIIKQIYINN